MTFMFGDRRISMLDLHLSICAIIWGLFLLIPPNDSFHAYVTLKNMGAWGLNEVTAGIGSVIWGVFSFWATFRGSYGYRRASLLGSSAWWILITISSLGAYPILPASGVYLTTSVMAGIQAIRAKHRPGSEMV